MYFDISVVWDNRGQNVHVNSNKELFLATMWEGFLRYQYSKYRVGCFYLVLIQFGEIIWISYGMLSVQLFYVLFVIMYFFQTSEECKSREEMVRT